MPFECDEHKLTDLLLTPLQVYVQDWCAQLPGCSILSVDYSVSPEAKFPVALQQLLDVYLFVSSDEADEVNKALGYRPEEFILAGESAGANLTMAVLLVLNDINRHIAANVASGKWSSGSAEAKPIRMPKSILNLYAPYNLTLNISPSMILASCDSMISAGVMLSCFEAYLPLVNLNEIGSETVNKKTLNEASSNLTSGRFSLSGLTHGLSSLISSSREKELEAFDEHKLNAEKVNDSSDWLEFIQTNNIYVQMMEMISSIVGSFKCKRFEFSQKTFCLFIFCGEGETLDDEESLGRPPVEAFIIDIHFH